MKRAILFVWLALALGLAGDGAAREQRARWSSTRPAVNETHIFEGDINRKGKPTGFHSRPGGKNPSGARVVRIVDGPNRQGVYIAEVEVRAGSGRWLKKRSTFFPDRLSRAQVIAAILHAYKNRTSGESEQFRGPSGLGFTIQGWTLRGDINTAHPIYQGGRG